MTMHSAVDKREKSLGENIIVILLFSLLMGTFIHYFFKSETPLAQSGFENIANNFAANVLLIRSQWYMDKRPSVVNVMETSVAGEVISQRLVPVNKLGWVEVSNSDLACQHIWQAVMATPMVFMKTPIAAIELKRHDPQHGQQQGTICRYSIPSGASFAYHAVDGKVAIGIK